ncbi:MULTISPECIES: hypothetical protein [unclassified Microcoleus]|uniref:hypothetical protein n=1 Tax=unclassified Microcoleus TaxID=2642155 RepID=UPI0025E16903|nr:MULTISPECIES: hypothetical protein [unclassified Microcoleus]
MQNFRQCHQLNHQPASIGPEGYAKIFPPILCFPGGYGKVRKQVIDTNAKQREDLRQQSIAVRCVIRTLQKIEVLRNSWPSNGKIYRSNQ